MMVKAVCEIPDAAGRASFPGAKSPGFFCAALWLVFVLTGVTGCAKEKTTTTSETRSAAGGPAVRADTGAAATTSPGAATDSGAARAAAAGAGSEVTLRTAKGEVKAYVAKPAGAGPFPGVIVVHEWWGLNPQIKGFADRLAGQGYVAIVPDLYHGRATDDPEKAHELLRGLSMPDAVADLRAAAAELRASPDVGPKPVGIVGFCMGGGLALQTALSGEPLKACAMFYGTPITDRAELRKLSCPVLAAFGAEDEGISADSIKAFQQALNDDGKQAEIKTYEKAGHAFMNEMRPSYRPEAAADAWSRLQKFLAQNLKS